MPKLFDRVKVNTSTTGTGDVTFGSVVSNAFLTPTEAGCADTDTVRYVIVDGTDYEEGIGTIKSSVAAMARTTVTKSKIGGTAGTTKLNLSGTAVIAFVASAADILNPANNLSELTNTGTAQTNLGGTTVGKALFTAVDAAAARTATGVDDIANADALAAVNAIINGDHAVSQENGATNITGITGTEKYISDQWTVTLSSFRTVSAQIVSDAPAGLSKSLKVTMPASTASPGSTDYLLIRHPIEGYRMQKFAFGTAGSKTATLGMWLKASVTGNYTIGLEDSGLTTTCLKSVALTAATWTYVTMDIPARTSGTWGVDSALGAYVFVSLSTGSSRVGSAGWNASNVFGISGDTNLASTASATMQITGAFLVPGGLPISSVRAPFLMRPFDTELQLCQRYFAKSYDYATSPGSATASAGQFNLVVAGLTSGTNLGRGDRSLPVRMRTDPTVTLYSPTTGSSGVIRDAANNTDVSASAVVVGETAFTWSATMSSAGTVMSFSGQYKADARF